LGSGASFHAVIVTEGCRQSTGYITPFAPRPPYGFPNSGGAFIRFSPQRTLACRRGRRIGGKG
jgi:hypothetical protein